MVQTAKGVNCGTKQKNLRVHPGEHPGAERGPAMDCPAGGGSAGAKHSAGQAVRQGLPPPPVQAAGAEIEKRRSALHQEHRPSRAQLWGDSGAVAAAHQGKGGGYRGAGHASAGHPPGQGPDGDLFK